jgi:hypothetical protein
MANEIKTPCLAILSAFMMAWLVLAACTSESHEDEIARAVEATVQAMPTATIKSTATVTKQPSPTTTPTESPTEKPMISLSLPTVTPTPLSRIFGEEIVALGCEYDEFQAIEFCSKYRTDDISDPIRITNFSADLDVAAYVGKGKAAPFLRWDIVYLGEEWLFVDEIVFVVDGVRYQVLVNTFTDLRTDVLDGGRVMEHYDALIDSYDVLLAIAFGEEVKVRLSGRNGTSDKVMTWREVEIIRRAMKTFEDAGGRFALQAADIGDITNYATPTPTLTPSPTPIPPHIVSNRAGKYGMSTVAYPVNMGGTVKWNDCVRDEILFQAIAARGLNFEKIGHDTDDPFAIDLYTQNGELVVRVFEGGDIEGYASSFVELIPGVTDYQLKVSGFGCWHITMTAQ